MERFIGNCLRSLFEQDILVEDYEIIVINDGSKDKSQEIVVSLQMEHRNLILINQENSGVSAARNKGISLAKGKYLLFIDADDYVKPNSLGRLVGRAESESLDVLFLNLSAYDIKGNFLGQNDYSHFHSKIFSGIETYKITRVKKEKDPDRSVGIIFCNTFLKKNNLLFFDNMPYLEDGHFSGKVLCMAIRCSFDNDPFYVRLINPDSASRSNVYNTSKARGGFINAALDLKDFKKNSDLTDAQRSLINHLIAKFIISSIISSIGSRNRMEILLVRRHIRHLGFNKLQSKDLVSNKCYVKAYNYSFWIFIFYYLLETRIRVLINMIRGRKNEDICY